MVYSSIPFFPPISHSLLPFPSFFHEVLLYPILSQAVTLPQPLIGTKRRCLTGTLFSSHCRHIVDIKSSGTWFPDPNDVKCTRSESYTSEGLCGLPICVHTHCVC